MNEKTHLMLFAGLGLVAYPLEPFDVVPNMPGKHKQSTGFAPGRLPAITPKLISTVLIT
jgi:hypothetical protein